MKEEKENNENTKELFEKLESSDLHFLNEAEIYQEIIKSGYSQRALGLKLNKTQSSIGNKLRLLNLSQECRSAILENNLTERHARVILRIRDDSKRIKTLKHIIDKKLSVKASENFIKNIYVNEEEAEIKNDPIIKTNLLRSALNENVKEFRLKGLKILTGIKENDVWTDLLIRVYK